MAYYAGTGQVIQADNRAGENDRDHMAHLKVVDTGREILQGDKLFPAETDIGDATSCRARRPTRSSTDRSSRFTTACTSRAATRCSR